MKYDPTYVWYITGPAFVFFLVVFKLVSPVVSRTVWPQYGSLSRPEKKKWDNRYVYMLTCFVITLIHMYECVYNINS